MSDEEFLAGLTGSPNDLALRSSGQPFCLIGGLAMNRYAEPIITLDADFAVVSATGAADSLRAAGFVVEEFQHSINTVLPGSPLRTQITINNRYGAFPTRAVTGSLFGVEMPIACLADIVQGKIWAATDSALRRSKRAKNQAGLIRLTELHPQIFGLVPPGTVPGLDENHPQPDDSRHAHPDVQ